jgi:type II secretory pathway pseudopilin PulG
MSLGELLIVVAIVMLLAIATLLVLSRQINRANDSRRKQDLVAIRSALEEYYNDNNQFPDETTWNSMNCKTEGGMSFLSKYLGGKNVPCDPQAKSTYHYEANPGGCSGFVLMASLRDTSDADISRLGCAATGCGYGYGYNYGVSAGDCRVPVAGFDPVATPAPTPVPGVTPGPFGCTSDGSGTEGCNNLGQAVLEAARCPSFDTFNCNSMCPTHPSYHIGSCP